jgi:uroporphyrin-III C-methyltransferase/precorrin-2 dehydrogenase/sirohydrochlorin ferrochelatase
MSDLLPLFLNLTGRLVALVGGGPVAAGKLRQLVAGGARVHVIAPDICAEIAGRRHANVELIRRAFVPSDLDEVWLAVAAATPEVNREVASAAENRRVFVNAVDDPANASAFLSGVVRRDGVTIAISTNGEAPALTALVREAVDALLPSDLGAWMAIARTARLEWKRDAVAMAQRKPSLLRALNARYREDARLEPVLSELTLRRAQGERVEGPRAPKEVEREASAERVPWLNGPEDSWP